MTPSEHLDPMHALSPASPLDGTVSRIAFNLDPDRQQIVSLEISYRARDGNVKSLRFHRVAIHERSPITLPAPVGCGFIIRDIGSRKWDGLAVEVGFFGSYGEEVSFWAERVEAVNGTEPESQA